MPQPSDDAFEKVLRSSWFAELERAGFGKTKGRWHFRRVRSPYIDLVELQRRSDGQAACVNLGLHLDFLPPPSSDNLRPEDCAIGNCAIQARLTPSDDLPDYWWGFGDTDLEAVRSAEDLIRCFVQRGLPFFDYYTDLPGPFGLVSVESLRVGSYLRVQIKGNFTSPALAALVLARIHEHLQDWTKAEAFAQFGIGFGLKHKFEPILIRTAQALGRT